MGSRERWMKEMEIPVNRNHIKVNNLALKKLEAEIECNHLTTFRSLSEP